MFDHTRTLFVILITAALMAGACKQTDDDDSSGDDDDATGSCAVLGFPQAVGDALWANPDVYPEVPLRLAVEGDVEAVEMDLGGQIVPAADVGEGSWMVSLPLGTLDAGFHTIVATAICADGSRPQATVELGLGNEGVRLTSFDEVSHATTPRIHRVGDGLWLSWVATYEEQREAWMQRIDGAGRWIGERILISGGAGDTLYAYTAFGDNAVAVLYQEGGAPYHDYLEIRDLDGAILLPAIDLNPDDWDGQYSGDVTYDGEGFIAAYRVTDSTGYSEVHWIRVDEQTLTVAGPVTAADSGDGTPYGGYDPFIFIKVAAVDSVSMVSFVRYRWDSMLLMEIPKAQLATLDRDGTVLDTQYAGPSSEFSWHWDGRVNRVGDRMLVTWSLSDLEDPDPNSPTLFHGSWADAEGTLELPGGNGQLMVDGVFDRMDPFAVGLEDGTGDQAVLLWTDLRSYEETPETGLIELWAAPLDADLAVADEVVFPHARFIAGSSELNGTAVGTNVLMVWEDERTGGGIMDPRPEVYLETAWF